MLSPRHLIDVGGLALAFVRYSWDVSQLDDVFALNARLMRLGDARTTERVVQAFREQPSGAEALRTRHRLGHLELQPLLALPPDTLGGAYARFMQTRGRGAERIVFALLSARINPLEHCPTRSR